MRLADKHPVKYKFWCVLKKITFNLFLSLRNLHNKVEEIHYDYWTYGKSLKELREIEILKLVEMEKVK